MITRMCQVSSADMLSDNTTSISITSESMISVNISNESVSSNSSADINCCITEYRKTVPIQEISTITKNNTVFEK